MRWTISARRSAPISSVTGMPETLVFDTTGTIWSPWPPSTKPVTSWADTFSSQAMNVRNRAVSSTPAMPKTRSLVKPASW